MKKIIMLLFVGVTACFAQKNDYSDYNILLGKYVSNNGKVDYEKLKINIVELNTVIKKFEKNQPNNLWTREEKLAYYINAYNIYTLKIVTDNYPVASIKEIKNVWDVKFIPSGSSKLSLGDIEHKILRKMNEPRIHFAINCASFSCPNLRNEAFLPETLNKQLETASKSFINDATKNILSEKSISISEIFEWFGDDFKTTDSTVIDFINKYAVIKISKSASIKFVKYNWSLNK
jgi:hypothetical protein